MNNSVRKKHFLRRALDDYLTIMRTMPLARLLMWFGGGLIFIIMSLAFFPKGRLELKDALQDVFQILSFLIAALMVLISIVDQERRTQQTAQQQIYQRLEIESIALFRFDIQNTDLAAYIWSDCPLPPYDNKTENIRLERYVAQILNLFEMAVRFRRENIMPHDVFGSWVIWINSLCASRNFCAYWRERDRDLQWNYIPELRDLINDGLNLHHGKEPRGDATNSSELVPEDRVKLDVFFEMVAKKFGCNVVGSWVRTGKPC